MDPLTSHLNAPKRYDNKLRVTKSALRLVVYDAAILTGGLCIFGVGWSLRQTDPSWVKTLLTGHAVMMLGAVLFVASVLALLLSCVSATVAARMTDITERLKPVALVLIIVITVVYYKTWLAFYDAILK